MAALIGIVGGIGSGKSAVAEQFRRRGAEVLDGDRLGHEVLCDAEVMEMLCGRWGGRVLERDDAGNVVRPHRISRSEVARVVFAGTPQAEKELHFLEGIVHPRIREKIVARTEAITRREEHAIVVLDAPLLLEAGWDEVCNGVIYVDVPRETRLRRIASRGWDAAELAAREARQWSCEQKRSHATWIVDNSGSLEELSDQIEPIWRSLTLPKST